MAAVLCRSRPASHGRAYVDYPRTTLRKTTREDMKKRKNDTSQRGESSSRLIDARIKELGDWRGETLSRIRSLINPRVVAGEMVAGAALARFKKLRLVVSTNRLDYRHRIGPCS
jgi:hypothetical protein